MDPRESDMHRSECPLCGARLLIWSLPYKHFYKEAQGWRGSSYLAALSLSACVASICLLSLKEMTTL